MPKYNSELDTCYSEVLRVMTQGFAFVDFLFIIIKLVIPPAHTKWVIPKHPTLIQILGSEFMLQQKLAWREKVKYTERTTRTWKYNNYLLLLSANNNFAFIPLG